MPRLSGVSDLREATEPAADGPPPPRRGRVALLVTACLVIAALVAVLVVALRGSPGPSASGGTGGTGVGAPGERSDTEAAVRNGWKMTAHDEFDGDELDDGLWSTYKGKTTDDVGQHDPDNLSVSDGTLKLSSHGKSSAGLHWNDGQRYGRWEARVRSQAGNGFGPVMLLWPVADDWPEGGEIDIMEIPKGDRRKAHFTVHWGESNKQDSATTTGDFTQWHTFAVEWTPDHIAGFVDGEEIYRTQESDANPPRAMHFAMQQDIGPYGDDWIPAPDSSTPDTCTFEVDWVRIYSA